MSQLANVARLQLIRIQRGLILNISLRAIAKIAKALNVSIDTLLETFVPTENQPATTITFK